MSWHRSFVRMAERTDVSTNLKKLWKKHAHVDGLVTQHLSPFEQHIQRSLFKDIHLKALKRVKEFLLEAGPGLGLGLLIYNYGEWKHKDLAYHHRS